MAIHRPAPGLKWRAFELWLLTRWVFNFCVRSTPLQGDDREDDELEDEEK